jgi:hypothetical protein
MPALLPWLSQRVMLAGAGHSGRKQTVADVRVRPEAVPRSCDQHKLPYSYERILHSLYITAISLPLMTFGTVSISWPKVGSAERDLVASYK